MRMNHTIIKTTSKVAAVALVVAGLLGTAAAQTEMSRTTLATGPAGGFYNRAGIALTNMLSEQLGVTSTARAYGGTTVYLPQLHLGQIALGMNSGLDASAAYLGEEPYPQAMTKLRAAMLLFRPAYALHADAASGIKSVADLKGKSVVTNYRGIASFGLVNTTLLKTAGLTIDDVEPMEEAGVREGFRSLIDGHLAATGGLISVGMVREADAALPEGIQVLNIGDNEDALQALPGFTAVTLKPGPGAVGYDEPVRVVQYDVYLNTSTNESADSVYRIVKTLHQNWTKLQNDVKGLRGVDADGLVPLNMSHPYHEGAIRYFKEVGLWTEEHDRRQSALLK